MGKKLITYTFCAIICGGYPSGNFSVQASNYDEARDKAIGILFEALKSLPGSISVDFDVELEFTNADEIFVKELCEAEYKYSGEHIDVVYSDEDNRVHIMYHSDNNSFSVFSIDADDFTVDDSSLGEYLMKIADEHGCGHQNLDVID